MKLFNLGIIQPFLVLITLHVSYISMAQTAYDPDWIGSGSINTAGFGWSIGVAGDVNGDGYTDLLVGSPDHAEPFPDEEEEGKAYLFYGGPDGISPTPAWSYQPNSYFAVCGFDVSGGDLNGDGYSDILVGSLIYSGVETKVGRAQLWYGGPDGPAAEPDWEHVGDQFLGLVGSGVNMEADINGDGYNEIFVAGKNYDSGEEDEGKVWMWNGSAAGPVGPTWTFESDDPGAIMGYPVNYAGDVNGDGYDDVTFGAAGYTNTLSEQGTAVVFFGGPAGLADEPDWQVYGEKKKDSFGHWTDGAGDVNGDGFDDIIVSAIWHESDSTEYNEGAAYVYLGGPAGPSTTYVWKTQNNQMDANYGYCVAGAGDVNGDGYDEVIVGSKYWTNPEYKEGASYVFWGSPSGPETEYCWFAEGNQDSSYMGRHVDGGADFNNDGYADFLNGAYRMTNILPFDGTVFCMYGGPREADFHYSTDSICKSDEVLVPTIDGLTGGTFSATGGLSINSITGEINLAPVSVGNYTITYAFDNGYCLIENSRDLYIGPEGNAAFTYPSDTLGLGSGGVSATASVGASLGTFSAVPEGIIFSDVSNGTINLALSSAGTYTITNTYFTGSCYVSYSSVITLSDNCNTAPAPYVEFVSETTALISWPVQSALSYNLYLVEGGDTLSFMGITDTSIFLSGLTPGTTYEIWMNSNCGTENSPNSSSLNFVTEGTGIASKTVNYNISVYPQPGDNQISVSCEDLPANKLIIRIFSYTGEELKAEKLIESNQKVVFDTHNWPNGNYLLLIHSENWTDVREISIVH